MITQESSLNLDEILDANDSIDPILIRENAYHYPSINLFSSKGEGQTQSPLTPHCLDMRIDGERPYPMPSFAQVHCEAVKDDTLLTLKLAPLTFTVTSIDSQRHRSIIERAIQGEKTDKPADLGDIALVNLRRSSNKMANLKVSEGGIPLLDPCQLLDYVLILGDKIVRLERFTFSAEEKYTVVEFKNTIPKGKLNEG
jgi:hypothetical protein